MSSLVLVTEVELIFCLSTFLFGMMYSGIGR